MFVAGETKASQEWVTGSRSPQEEMAEHLVLLVLCRQRCLVLSWFLTSLPNAEMLHPESSTHIKQQASRPWFLLVLLPSL